MDTTKREYLLRAAIVGAKEWIEQWTRELEALSPANGAANGARRVTFRRAVPVAPQPPPPPPPPPPAAKAGEKRRGRGYTVAQRKAQSNRMREFWAGRRAIQHAAAKKSRRKAVA